MKVLIKNGVTIKEINARFFHVCISAFWVWEKYGQIPVITDGWRNDPASLHSKNLAWDLRIWGLPDPKAAADELRKVLNIKHYDYDVVYGDAKHLDHVHIEYDPKGN